MFDKLSLKILNVFKRRAEFNDKQRISKSQEPGCKYRIYILFVKSKWPFAHLEKLPIPNLSKFADF